MQPGRPAGGAASIVNLELRGAALDALLIRSPIDKRAAVEALANSAPEPDPGLEPRNGS